MFHEGLSGYWNITSSDYSKLDYVITEFPTRVNLYILLGEMWWNVGRSQQVLLYSSVNDDIAHIVVQLQREDKLSNSVMYYLYNIVLQLTVGSSAQR